MPPIAARRSNKFDRSIASPSTPIAAPVPEATTPQPADEHPELPVGVPYASSADPVRIESIQLSSDVVRGGDTESARIITTSNAAALTARIGTYQVNVPRIAPGTFALTMTVPHVTVPDHHIDIVVTAIRADGATTQRTVPLTVYF